VHILSGLGPVAAAASESASCRLTASGPGTVTGRLAQQLRLARALLRRSDKNGDLTERC
jgi:hypothetical protein